MAYEAAILDLDGTILDTLDDLAAAVNHALGAFGLPEQSREHTRLSVGNGIRRLIARSVPEGTDPQLEEQVFEEFRSFYATHANVLTGPYPGMPELLVRLRAAGVKLAVVSNKGDNVVQALIEEHYPGIFDHVAGEKEGVPRKPAPDSTLAALAALGASPERTAYVGDSEVDVATASNAGLPCITCTWGFRTRDVLEAAGATTFVDSMEELEQALLANPRQ